MQSRFHAVFAAALAASLLLAPMASPAQATSNFNLPAQKLADSLRAVASQTNSNILFDKELVGGLSAQPLKAQVSMQEALRQLLQGTGLTYRYLDERTVTIVRQSEAAAAAAPDVLAQNTATSGQQTKASSRESEEHGLQRVKKPQADENESGQSGERREGEESGAAEGEREVRVTGSRIRRDPAETDVSPVTVFTRQDIERSGAFILSDFISTRINQASGGTLNQQNDGNRDPFNNVTGEDPMSGRLTVNLRGLGNNTTLVLMNGRRLPKSGQGFGQDDYNLNGIPIAFIERIEVLPNSASAIYGADAIGGVINIITRSDYSGIDVGLQYGNTFDSDVSEKSANVTFGHAGTVLSGRNYQFTLGLHSSERNKLAALDRPYTAFSDYSSTGGTPPDEPNPYFGLISGAGSVAALPNDEEFEPALPGVGVNWVAIPNGQNGRDLTQADFLNSGPVRSADIDVPFYRQIVSPNTEASGSLSASLDLTERMQLFVEGTHYEYESKYSGLPPAGEIPVPADNPFNPFGVDVEVNKLFYELGPSRGIREDTNTRIASGLRGGIFQNWNYELYGDHSRHVHQIANPMPVNINFLPQYVFGPGGLQTIPTPGSTAIAVTDPSRALNVFGDARTTQPHTNIDILRAIIGVDDYRERSEASVGAFQADGPIAQLPGGLLKLAFGGEFRKEKVDFHKLNTTGRFYLSLDEGAERDVKAAFAELSVPLIGENQQIPGAQTLLLSLAGRVDSESQFGEEFTPKVGLMWRPVPQLALRTAFSLGYKVPNLQQLFAPDQTGFSFFPEALHDPVTGNDIFFVNVRDGGNPDLEPEESESWSAGFIYEPEWLPRFSLSVDYFDIDYTNKVEGFILEQTILDLFPERVTRNPTTNAVTLIDRRAINLSSASARGIDLRMVHRIQTADRGAFDARLNYTYNISSTQQTSPLAPVVENVDESYYPRVRANADLFWMYRGFEIGPTAIYESSTRNTSLFGEEVFPSRIRHAVVFDLQGSFDFDGGGVRGMGDWTEGMKLTLGINNVLDRTPSPTDGAGGYAKIDPRQRRFYLALRKSF